MKILGIVALTLFAVQANATNSASISCSGSAYGTTTVTLKADYYQVFSPTEARLVNVSVTHKEKNSYSSSVETGRAEYLSSDAKYNPRKYKNHFRFDGSALTDTKTFGKFHPGDQCLLSILIPKNAATKKSAEVPVVANCDQGGGTIVMKCTLNPKLD